MTRARTADRAALVIAGVALLLALSGGAYAASKIGTKQLKNGAVTAKKLRGGAVKAAHLRNGAVTAAKIRSGAVRRPQLRAGAVTTAKLADAAVTGAGLDESTLGTVPEAEGFDVIPLRIVSSSATASTEAAARAAATRIPLASHGPFTLYGKCFQGQVPPAFPDIQADIYLETSSEGVVFESAEDDSGSGFIGPGTPEADRVVLGEWNAVTPIDSGAVFVTDPTDMHFWAKHSGGFIEGHLLAGVKRGDPPTGNGPFGPGERCLFGGVIRWR